MADISVQRKSRGQWTWLLMLLALLLTAGFLAWLALESEPTEVAVIEETEDEEDPLAAAAPVPIGDLVVNARAFTGQQVRLDSVNVNSALGPRAFWIDTPSGAPYLIHFDSAAARGVNLQPGSTLSVIGEVQPMTDSVVRAWEEQGLIQPSQRSEAQYATTFVNAVRVSRFAGARAGG